MPEKKSIARNTIPLAPTQAAKQWIFLKNVARLIAWAESQGFELTGGELYRPQATQKIYLQQGLSRTANSRHTQRLAIDLNLFIGGKYQTQTLAYRPLGIFWCSLHTLNRWGGDWNGNGLSSDEKLQDGNHFEMA